MDGAGTSLLIVSQPVLPVVAAIYAAGQGFGPDIAVKGRLAPGLVNPFLERLETGFGGYHFRSWQFVVFEEM